MKKLGLYIHIPFCLRKCFYCDFCSFPGQNGERMGDYARELCRRLVAFAPLASAYAVDTVYFGGGTPTLLPAPLTERMLQTIREHFSLTKDAEITLECNPATASRDSLRALRSLGINRLSIGLQSVHDRELSLLGRAHSFSDFCKTYEDARHAGFDNVSVDLMYGLPDQSLDGFEASVDTLLAMKPEHLSAYGLKIEDGTRFARIQSTLRMPDEDTELSMYRSLIQRAESAGLLQYEISNFAKPGYESRHNLRYWRREDYVGFGLAAYSCFRGERFGNSRDIDAFLRGEDITAERESLTEEDRREEMIMLSLRLKEGLSLSDYECRFGRDLLREHPSLGRYIEAGYMEMEGDRIRFTANGFFVSNSILAELL